jgi:ankyrin repeat protein
VIAAAHGRLEEVKKLIQNGAKGDAPGESIPFSALHAAAEFGRLDILEFLLAKGADVNSFDRARASTPLIVSSAAAAKFLLEKGANPIFKAATGRTALHQASESGDLAKVSALLTHGADPKLIDRKGNGAHHLVREGPEAKIITRLLKGTLTPKSALEEKEYLECQARARSLARYVEINGENFDDHIKLCPASAIRPEHLSPALRVAAREGMVNAITKLLERGADVNGTKGEETPLMVAATEARLPVVELLLKNKADPDRRNSAGQTALMRAVETGNPSLVETILKAGAKRELKDKKGRMAVHYAQERKLKELEDRLSDYTR